MDTIKNAFEDGDIPREDLIKAMAWAIAAGSKRTPIESIVVEEGTEHIDTSTLPHRKFKYLNGDWVDVATAGYYREEYDTSRE